MSMLATKMLMVCMEASQGRVKSGIQSIPPFLRKENMFTGIGYVICCLFKVYRA